MWGKVGLLRRFKHKIIIVDWVWSMYDACSDIYSRST